MERFSLQPYTERGWLVGFGSRADAAALLGALRRRAPARLEEFVPGFAALLLIFEVPVERALVSGWLAEVAEADDSVAGGVHHRIEVRYTGEDLGEVARRAGMSVAEVVALHSAPEYTLAVLGFSPGFGYLDGLDVRLHLPRREVPRARVPAGSVAIGGEHAGIYPAASAGGWHLLGTTGFVLFRPERAAGDRPDPREVFTLAPGDRVTFVPIL